MEEPLYYDVLPSPIGRILITTTDRGVRSLHFPLRGDPSTLLGKHPIHSPRKTAAVHRQLTRYFQGTLKRFSLRLDLRGTPFQMDVWKELLRIPYGTTASYAEIARRLGRPKAARAVGMANHRNPIGIIVPCHRIVGTDGSLTGYAGGLQIKKQLLAHEARHA